MSCLNKSLPILNTFRSTVFGETQGFASALCDFSFFLKLRIHLNGKMWGHGGLIKKYGLASHHIKRGISEVLQTMEKTHWNNWVEC